MMTQKSYESWDVKTQTWYSPNHSTPPTLIGNTGDAIQWDAIIGGLANLEGNKLPRYDWNNTLLSPMTKLFNDSKYNSFSAEWINYYPGIHYPSEVDTAFGKVVNKPRCVRAWISKINPGHTAPWHWDLDDNEAEYLKNGELVRFICKACVPAIGHVAVIGDYPVYGGNQGDIFQWPDTRSWHGSVNCGLVPKYQYNYLAYV